MHFTGYVVINQKAIKIKVFVISTADVVTQIKPVRNTQISVFGLYLQSL